VPPAAGSARRSGGTKAVLRRHQRSVMCRYDMQKTHAACAKREIDLCHGSVSETPCTRQHAVSAAAMMPRLLSLLTPDVAVVVRAQRDTQRSTQGMFSSVYGAMSHAEEAQR
jgi:hypothetical protein